MTLKNKSHPGAKMTNGSNLQRWCSHGSPRILGRQGGEVISFTGPASAGEREAFEVHKAEGLKKSSG